MRKRLLLLIFFQFGIQIYAQQNSRSFLGNWLGSINTQGISLRIGLVVSDSSGIINAFLCSPDQGVMKINVDEFAINIDSVRFVSREVQGSYRGVMNEKGDSILGEWKQGKRFVLKFKKTSKIPGMSRPQEPQRPFPYIEMEVNFRNEKEGITLAGTLTIPDTNGKFPAVILVSGSGPQNRDEEILGHKPFLIISDFLTRKGFAVLRYDDRGTGASGGVFNIATTADLSNDAEAAFKWITANKYVVSNKTGIIGHSEGGMIAPMVASRNMNVAFIVLLAGPGIRGKELLIQQSQLIARAEGTPENEIKENNQLNKKFYQILKKEKDDKKAIEKMRKLIDNYWNKLKPEDIEKLGLDKKVLIQSIYQFVSPWFRYFINYNPADYLSKVSCKVLVLNGSLDLQVPSKPNLEAIRMILEKSNNNQFTIKEFAGLNHLFQPCKSGSPTEYVEIEESFSPEVLEFMTNWLVESCR